MSCSFNFQISGRLIFEFNPDLVEGDDEDEGVVEYSREDSDDEVWIFALIWVITRFVFG